MKKYIFGAILSLGILVSPAFTQAATLTDAQIQSILSLLSVFGADSATIANVNSALTGGTPTSSAQSFCYTFNNDLTGGSSGTDVSALNQALRLSGIETSSNTSVFDENTAGDVVSFQVKYGIRQTGYVGPLTRAQLNKLYGCHNSQQPTETVSTSPVPSQIFPVSEQVKCIFNGATTEQKCWGDLPSVGDPIRYSCAGVGTCVVMVKGLKGTPITLGSSCGGSANITIDGNNEYADFKCTIVPAIPETTSSAITVINPNGGGYWYRGNYAAVEWKTAGVPQDSQMLIRLRSIDTKQEYNLATVNNSGRAEIAVPATIPVGAYNLEIKTAVNGQSYLDASDSYFKILDTPTTAISTALPNLQVISISPTTVQANQITSFTATIKNVGPVDVKTPFAVNVNGTAVTVNSLAAGQTTTVSASSGLTILGPNQFCVPVDIWDAVAESDESNNTTCWSVDVYTATTTSELAPAPTSSGGGGGSGPVISVPMSLNSTESNSVNQMASALSAFNSATGEHAGSSYTWNRDLQIGSPYTDDTIALQRALAREGVYAGEITGGFYNQTFLAVKAFQQKYGIEATGFVGPDTRTKLNALY